MDGGLERRVMLTSFGRPHLSAFKEAHRRGVCVWAWTVTDRAVAARMLELGVDGVMTDDPSAYFVA